MVKRLLPNMKKFVVRIVGSNEKFIERTWAKDKYGGRVQSPEGGFVFSDRETTVEKLCECGVVVDKNKIATHCHGIFELLQENREFKVLYQEAEVNKKYNCY